MSTKRVRFGTQSVKSSSTRSGGSRSGNKATKKAKPKKRPDWDTTVRDLTIHKLSKEEQEKRRLSFQSKNAEAAKHDLYEKAKGSFDLDVSGNLRPSPTLSGVSRHNRNSSKLATLHQALHGKELHDVLAESDRALAVVRDLFGDDPKRYTCQPNVTVAPHIITDKGKLERTILESQGDGPCPTVLASPGGIRDESILKLAPRKPALNELPLPTQGELEDDATLTASDDERADSADLIPHGRCYQPSVDLTRFQKLIQSEETTREETHHHKMPHISHITSSLKATEVLSSEQKEERDTQPEKHGRRHIHSSMPLQSSMDGQDCLKSLGEHSPNKQAISVREQDNKNSSVDAMSELSSIPPETEGRANITVDSEASSVQPSTPVHLTVGRGGTAEQPIPPLVTDRDGDVSLVERDRRRPQVVTSSLTQHPLHVVHKMAPSSHKKKVSQELERDIEQGHQDKVHSQLHTLEQMVEKLEHELAAYEEASNLTVSLSDITNTPQNQSPTHHRPRSGGSLGSITKSLLSSMTKMMSYLRQSEVQLKGEVAVRVQMLQTMTEQQNLMDSLTADLIKLRSENISLRQELSDLKKTSSEQIRKIQGDFADVHKKLSSLAVSHAHQTPALSYVQPHLPLLPPHLLQTPPPFPLPQSQSEHHTIHTEHSTFPHSSTVSYVTASTTGGVSQLSTTNTSRIGVQSQFTPVSSSSSRVAPLPSASSLAPPPLSEALRVPGFDMPPRVSHQSHSSTSTSTTVPSMSNNLLASKPAFDVEAFISSLRKNQPQLGTSSTASSSSLSSSAAMPVSKAGAPVSLSQPHQVHAAKLYPSVISQRDRTVPTVDLSVSLPSSVPEDEESRKEYSETTETSEQTDFSEQQAESTAHPSVVQRHFQESGVIGHSAADTAAVTEDSGSTHIGLPPGYMLQHQGQGLANAKLKPGWFALTSHLSHS